MNNNLTDWHRTTAAGVAAATAHGIERTGLAVAKGNHLSAANDEPEPEDGIAELFETIEPGLNIKAYGADVRTVNYGSTVCFEGKDDIVIEQRVGGNWTRVRTFNSLSNDYAHTESQREARALADRLLGVAG